MQLTDVCEDWQSRHWTRMATIFAAKRRASAKKSNPTAQAAKPDAPAPRFRAPVPAPDPPRRHKWLLVLASLVLAAWLCFLLAIALSGV